jgi:hypothetical protein
MAKSDAAAVYATYSGLWDAIVAARRVISETPMTAIVVAAPKRIVFHVARGWREASVRD